MTVLHLHYTFLVDMKGKGLLSSIIYSILPSFSEYNIRKAILIFLKVGSEILRKVEIDINIEN